MEYISGLLKKPAALALLSAVAGLILGLVFAWKISPLQIEYSEVDPSLLQQSYQEDYLRMAIDSYGANNNGTLAIERYKALGTNGSTLLRAIQSNPQGLNPMLIISFSSLVTQSGNVPTAATTAVSTMVSTPAGDNGQSKGMSSTLKGALVIIALVVLGVVFYFGAKVLRPLARRTGAPTAAQQARDISRQVEKIDYAAMGEEPPIAQFVTTYVVGDDLFDDSFSIETGSGEFLGECGVGISETIGVTDNPKRVSAFEIWLFDKSDIQTVTKVVMSSHAFNDPNTLNRLQAKGEPLLAESGKQIVLETAAIQMVATISDMEYGQGALPDGSFFSRVTLELAIWPKATA
jgi:hypothetical protein